MLQIEDNFPSVLWCQHHEDLQFVRMFVLRIKNHLFGQCTLRA